MVHRPPIQTLNLVVNLRTHTPPIPLQKKAASTQLGTRVLPLQKAQQPNQDALGSKSTPLSINFPILISCQNKTHITQLPLSLPPARPLRRATPSLRTTGKTSPLRR